MAGPARTRCVTSGPSNPPTTKLCNISWRRPRSHSYPPCHNWCSARKSSSESRAQPLASPAIHKLQVRHPVRRSPRLSISTSSCPQLWQRSMPLWHERSSSWPFANLRFRDPPGHIQIHFPEVERFRRRKPRMRSGHFGHTALEIQKPAEVVRRRETAAMHGILAQETGQNTCSSRGRCAAGHH